MSTKLPSMLVPMIRRTFPELLATDLLSIQPMTGPSGSVFIMNHVTESAEEKNKRYKECALHSSNDEAGLGEILDII